ncbi:hypothetical protein MCG98_04335 [Ruminococcus sp. OA3]|uniref:hypothetical protein n=1 Tax=Ruminococcus sp. OA3 TaxID=2914164 RepID=UPI001F06DC6C|nr:hypothetical protein [Ruminococcus sp. OA3]MCH1981798.1 hypothetical protein [Ruminococcus sp. OA3]
MQLYEKLTFMMNLTQTSNRMLARELQVDPSLISRLRTGTRGVPRNREYLKIMALYFTKRCTTKYQRQALSEMLGISLSHTVKSDQLTDLLYYWLLGDSDEVGHFLRTFETLTLENRSTDSLPESCDINTDNALYFGSEGKRAAARTLIRHLLSLDKPCTVFLFADQSDEWISEDPEFLCSLQDWGLKLVQQGFQFCHITPPVSSADHAFDSLLRWIPVYLTGRANAYYYPRIRDQVHRRTLVLVPGEVAMTSNSIAGRQSGYATMLTTDLRLIQTYETEFQDYLSLCRPMMDIYTMPEKLKQCFTKFLTSTGTRIQKLPALSAETAPPELMDYCIEKTKYVDLKRLGRLFIDEMRLIEKERDKYELIDIVSLATAEEVRAGMVPIILSCGMNKEPLRYTPETYVLHLKNILRIMERCDNYHFVPQREPSYKEGGLMVKEGQHALLLRMTSSFTVFEISQPDIVLVCREHLFRIADRSGYMGIHRIKIISQIRELIRELQV